MNQELDLLLVGPEVMAVRAAQFRAGDPHLDWFVGFAPEYDDEGRGRVVFGTLHASDVDGTAEVEVACMMRYPAHLDPGVDRFGEILASSDALESLWDVARIAFRATAATANLSVQPPAKAPPAQITQLTRSSSSQAEPTTADGDATSV